MKLKNFSTVIPASPKRGSISRRRKWLDIRRQRHNGETEIKMDARLNMSGMTTASCHPRN
jgi:hypothetical protein